MSARQRRGAPGQAARSARFVLLTGLSGSGKSQAIRALEDLGYFCVDNLPTPLIATVAELSLRASSEIDRVAIVVDVRERSLLATLPKVVRDLRAMSGLRPVIVFLEASDGVLVRRFSETRRPHPVAKGRSVREGITDERRQLAPIRRLADEVIDTSAMNVHELRDAFMRLFREVSARAPRLVVTIQSFGFKHGLPPDADLVFDVRFLPNPYFVSALRRCTGRAPSVVRYLMEFPVTKEFLERATALLDFLLPQYVTEGKSYLTIAVGCTGGRHRSVAVANALRGRLGRVRGVVLRVHHRDVSMS